MKFIIATLSSAVLAACGGGGGGDPILQEGLYLGPSVNYMDNTGRPSSILILENNEVWSLEGYADTSFFIQGAFQFGDAGTLSKDFSFDQAQAFVATGSGRSLSMAPAHLRSFVAGDKSVAEVSSPLQTHGSLPTVGTLVSAATGFDYHKPASTQDLEGKWESLLISSSGAMSGTSPQYEITPCTVAGRFVPRPGGKNVFNLTVALTGCADAGSYSGIAFTYMDSAQYAGTPPYTVPTLRFAAISSDKKKLFSYTVRK